MHFSANASDINQGMSLVSHALSARPIRTIFEGVLIETADEGVYFTCSDGEMTIRTRINATVIEEGVAVMPAKLFGELLRKLSGEIDISIDRNFRATIRAQGSNTSMAGVNAAEFPDVLEVKPNFEVTLPQGRLRDAVSRIMFAVSTDETRPILTGCLMEVQQDETRFVGLDGFRLALQRIQCENALPEGKDYVAAVVPGRIMGEFCRMLAENDEPVRISCSNNRMLMAFDNTECYCMLLTGEYINYKQIVPLAWKRGEAKLRRDDFIGAIERASLMAREGKNNLLRLSITGDEMTITANAERGTVLEHIPVSYSQEEFKIAFNARYLSDVIRNVDTDEICMRFNSEVSPCIIAPVSGNQYTYLVLPVRVLGQD